MAITVYHVFTHEQDEWYDDFSEAKAQYLEWGDECGSARLYRQVYSHRQDDEPVAEDCLASTGEYPM